MIISQFSSGNSSVVEHDLAKVGVASSNLVSRSIFFLLFTVSLLNSSSKILIKDNYCADNLTKITASFFTKDKKNDFQIIDLPKNISSYSVSSLKIVSKFKENNISFADLSNGVVTFKKCISPINFNEIKKKVLKKFKTKYPSIKIKKITIIQTSPLPPSLSYYKLKDIDLKENDYRNSSGVFGVIYKRDRESKKIYLRYKIYGDILVFKASYNLRNGKILRDNDYKKVEIKFDKLPLHVMSGEINQSYIIKGYIRKGSILSKNDFRIKKSLLKNDYIQAILKDENLILEIDAHLLSDANIGDIVKIKTVQGKVFKAKIISLKSAMILE